VWGGVDGRVVPWPRLRSLAFDRWHDADGTGQWSTPSCGGDITAYRTFDGLAIPSAGRFGWFYGTDRWSEEEFLRYEITAFNLER
jgi:hypothetical protein